MQHRVKRLRQWRMKRRMWVLTVDANPGPRPLSRVRSLKAQKRDDGHERDATGGYRRHG